MDVSPTHCVHWGNPAAQWAAWVPESRRWAILQTSSLSSFLVALEALTLAFTCAFALKLLVTSLKTSLQLFVIDRTSVGLVIQMKAEAMKGSTVQLGMMTLLGLQRAAHGTVPRAVHFVVGLSSVIG